MKELKFKTCKGEFLVVDDVNGIGKNIPYDLVTKIGYIKNLTEEQVSDIVQIDEHFHGKDYYKNYINNNKNFLNPIESLHSLLKSKGIHLYDNPYDLDEQLDCNCDMCYQKLEDAFDEAEEKTFYNPYIFKL